MAMRFVRGLMVLAVPGVNLELAAGRGVDRPRRPVLVVEQLMDALAAEERQRGDRDTEPAQERGGAGGHALTDQHAPRTPVKRQAQPSSGTTRSTTKSGSVPEAPSTVFSPAASTALVVNITPPSRRSEQSVTERLPCSRS